MGGGAWPFLVGGVICLVNSVNERDLEWWLLMWICTFVIHKSFFRVISESVSKWTLKPKLIEISLNVNVLFYSFQTYIHMKANTRQDFHTIIFFQRVYLAVVRTSSSYIRYKQRVMYIVYYTSNYFCPIENILSNPLRFGYINYNYYLLKIIQEFWLVKSCGWNRNIRSVVAQIWRYYITIEYWKHIYDIMT